MKHEGREKWISCGWNREAGRTTPVLPLALVLALLLGGGFYLFVASPGTNPSTTLNAQQDRQASRASGDRAELLDDERNTVEIVRSHGPRVVAIQMTVEGERISPFRAPQRQGGGGSGFLVDEEGRIITNYHVVLPVLEGNTLEMLPGATLTVSFLQNPDEEFPVRVHGANPDVDLALLEFVEPDDRPDVPPISLGDSDLVEVGQKVIAIGNPFGLHSTVTTGIVSAIERERPGIAGIEIPYIQTDAAINPGNSGGPLLDSDGRLIGINNAILGPGAFIGIGFAVPSALLLENLGELRAGGLSGWVAAAAEIPERPRLGLSTGVSVDDLPDEVIEELDLPEHGVVVESVTPGGPADEAGIEGPRIGIVIGGAVFPAGGDIITGIDGRPVRTIRDVQEVILEREAGDVVTLTVWRDGGTRSVDVELEVVPVPDG